MVDTLNKENLIRGRIVEISARIENALKAIILLATQNKMTLDISEEEEKRLLIKYRGMRFDQKVSKALDLINEYYPTLKDKAQSTFNRAGEIFLYRHRVTHCTFEWPDKSLSYFHIWDIIETDGVQHHAPFKYTIEQHLANVEEFKRVAVASLEIVQEIAKDINGKLPGFFPPEVEE